MTANDTCNIQFAPSGELLLLPVGMAGGAIGQIKDVLFRMLFLHLLGLVLVAPVASVLIQSIGMAGRTVALCITMVEREAVAAAVLSRLPTIHSVAAGAIGAETPAMCIVAAVA